MAFRREQAEQLPLTDRGLNYGDGLFETLRVCHGQIPLIQDHLCRLQQGMARLGLAGDVQLLARELVMEAAHMSDGLLKLLLVREGGERGYCPRSEHAWFQLTAYPLPDSRDTGHGIRVALAEMRLSSQPLLAGIKHLNRLEQVLAAAEAHRRGVDELWLTDNRGQLVEGVQSNLFVLENGRAKTPPLDTSGVAGVVRAWAMRTLQAHGIPCMVEACFPGEIQQVEAAFMTSSGQGVMAVAAVDGHALDAHHEVVGLLKQAWNELLNPETRR